MPDVDPLLPKQRKPIVVAILAIAITLGLIAIVLLFAFARRGGG
jgi:hypothetical protein